MAKIPVIDRFVADDTTIVVAGTTFSNAIKTTSADNARIFLDVDVATGGTLSVVIEHSPEGQIFWDLAQFDVIAAPTKPFPIILPGDQMSVFMRMRFVVTGGSPSFKIRRAILEQKQTFR